MSQKRERPLLDERGLHLTSIRGVNQMRGTCPICGRQDKPLHRIQGKYWCAMCVRKKKKKEMANKTKQL